jgi:thiol-disulfide isomerase/thioredoxin
MLRKLPILIIFSLATQFLFAKAQDEVIIIGQIDDGLARTVLFSFKKNPFTGEQAVFEAVTNENKQFVTKVKLKQPSVVVMKYQNRAMRLYLSPGDTLKLRFNGARPLETAIFDGSSGQIALQNTYMQQSLVRFSDWLDESFLSNLLHNRASTEYHKYINDIYTRKKDFLDTYAQEKKELFSEAFLDYINSDVEYWRAYHLMKYYDVFGLNNSSHPISDYYFFFMNDVDNMNFKALNNDYYLSYIEIFLKYWKEKSKEGQALSNQPDLIEEKTRVERIVKPPFVNTRVLEEPFATEKTISWLTKGEEAVYLNLHTAEKFKYVGHDTIFEDTYYKVQTMDNKIGWVPASLVNLEEKTRVIRTMRMRNCLDPNSPLCGFEQHLAGKILYFMVAKDIMFSALNDSEAGTEQRIKDFNVNNLYPEFTELLNIVFQNVKADKVSGNNRLRIPDFIDFNYHTMDPYLLANALYKLKPVSIPLPPEVIASQQPAEKSQKDNSGTQTAEDAALAIIRQRDLDNKVREAAALEAKKVEEAKIAAMEAKKIEDAKLLAEMEAKKIEDEKKLAAIEAKKIEDAKIEAKKIEDAKMAAMEAKKIEDARLTEIEEAKKEEKRVADAKARQEQAEKAALAKVEAETKARQEQLERDQKAKNDALAEQKAREIEIEKRIKAKRDEYVADSIKTATALAINQTTKVDQSKELAAQIAKENNELAELRRQKKAIEEELKQQSAKFATEKAEAEKVAKMAAAKLAADKAETERVAKIAADKLAADKAKLAEAEKAAKIEAERLKAEKAKIAADKAEADKAAKLLAERIAAEDKAAKLLAERIAAERAEIERVKNLPKPVTQPIQSPPSVAIAVPAPTATTDGIQLVSSKPGIELDNSINAVPLDATIYKPGATVRFDGMLINEGVPPFSFVDINGKEVRQPDLLGKVVYIDFWATWCAPCKEHIRYIQSTIEETKDKDIVYLFISVDKDPNKWRNYVKENNLGGIHVNDQQGLVSMYWNIQALPNYFLLGKDGRVAINSFIKSKKTLEDMIKYLLATNYQGEKK